MKTNVLEQEDIYKRFYWLVVLVYILEFIRPQTSILPFLSPLKLPAIVTVVLFLIFLKGKKDFLKDRLMKLIMAFIFIVAFSVTYAVNTFYVYTITVAFFWMFFGVICSTILVLNDSERLVKFFRIWVYIQTGVALYVITHGGKGTGSFLTDENDVALVLNMAIPYAFYFGYSNRSSKLMKLLMFACLFILVLAVGVSFSRGGLVGLVAVFLMLLIYSKRPFRNIIYVSIFLTIFGGIFLSLLPDKYITDMQSMSDPEDNTRQHRIMHWATAWEMYKDNPVLGVGAGNYPWNFINYHHLTKYYNPHSRVRAGRAAHSLYFTLIPELGTIGVIIYSMLLYTTFSRLNKTVKVREAAATDHIDFEVLLIAKSIRVSIVGFLVTGLFITVLYYPPFWYTLGFSYIVTKQHFVNT
jgi:probable O-glycosylation ligase (exosortase A-associated)